MSTSVKPQNRGLVMAAVFIATFMTSVEVTIVTTALSKLDHECLLAHNRYYHTDLW